MSYAIGALERGSRPESVDEPVPHPPFLRTIRTFRAQPRRVNPRVVAAFLAVAALLFCKVWESTVASSLSMERDRLAREVRGLENQIRISRDLKEQAALTSEIDPAYLAQLGFVNPDPARVVDIDLSAFRKPSPSKGSLATGLQGLLRRALPKSMAERVVGLPAEPVEARGVR